MRKTLALIAACIAFAISGPTAATAQQPTSVNPTASSVQEDKLLNALKPNESLSGRVTIPDSQSRLLIQPEGRDYQAEREQSAQLGGYIIVGAFAVLSLFYLVRGRIKITGGPSGRTITRFGFLDRFAHWLTSTSFLLLALTGLNLSFGRTLVLPIVGPETFTVLTQYGKFTHNYISFAFAAGIILMFLLWVKDNLPALGDIRWFAQGGGLIGLGHPPADRFNGGQKLIFWSVVGIGGAIAVTGYMMMFPFQGTTMADMQWANVWHGLLGFILFAIMIAHIYIGSLGMEGAFAAMGSGQVDTNWAREHHSEWVAKMDTDANGALSDAKPTPAE